MRLELFGQFLRFSAIGVLNTLIHLGVVMGLVESGLLPPVPANGLAFVTANLFSFWANSHITFKTAPSLRRYSRFLCVSVAGLLLTLAASLVGERLAWHYLGGVLLSFVLLPVLSFAANRFWTWREPTR
ncbi:GtrA family protein [Xenophilus sp. Marseille-Q4582]|uniref:GtrA family protein n=1 Tax=Xenophilus sp. Marseille-Q4582 TaxID=2866600 RepID=UPI001CE43518|nr:GtrA family protein [Xenophilus sp. Marseille-Q4582]